MTSATCAWSEECQMPTLVEPQCATDRQQRVASVSMATPNFTPGAFFGYLKLLGRVRVPKSTPANRRVVWRVECICGKLLKVAQIYMQRPDNPKHHCGCLNKTLKTLYNREYRIWLMMHQRCYNVRHVAYNHYGGRGINICNVWHRDVAGMDDGFETFIRHIGPAPTIRHSIDRIQVNGNYEPGNVKWSTDAEQAANRRKE